MTAVLSPLAVQRFVDNSGNPLASGKLYTYSAGTSTLAVTYTDSTQTTQNANPIVLNARGECNLWIPPNTAFKYILQDSAGNQIWAIDQIVNSQLITLYGGVDTGAANAYILTFNASFSAYNDGVVIYWIPTHNNTGASTINVNGLGVVSITNPNGSALGANQIVANAMAQIIMKGGVFQLLSVGNFTGVNVGTFGTETAIASAATTDLGSAGAHVVSVTGSTTITSFGSSAQTVAPIYSVRFAAAPLLTYNASSLILPGAANIQAAAGDALIAEYLGSGNWQVLLYQPAAALTVATTGNFTGTLTGFTANPTGTCVWAQVGNLVTLFVPSMTATSNSTNMTLTGMPNAINPARTQVVTVINLENSSQTGMLGLASLAANVITFGLSATLAGANPVGIGTPVGGGFTASGTKGIATGGFTISYLLN